MIRCRVGHGHKDRPDVKNTNQFIKANPKFVTTCLSSPTISEMCKAHYQKLISAIELYSMSVTFIPFDALAEFILGEDRHKLREDCFAFIHGLQELALMPFRKLTSSNQKK